MNLIFLQLEKKVAEYNSLARKLKLIPADAENANGIDFELRLTFGNQASISHFVNTIKVNCSCFVFNSKEMCCL